MSITQEESNQFFMWMFGLIGQAFVSFADGFQVIEDVPDFADEAFDSVQAIQGLVAKFKEEAKTATPESIDAMFDPITENLIEKREINPLLAKTMVGHAKSFYSTYCLIVQGEKEPEGGLLLDQVPPKDNLADKASS